MTECNILEPLETSPDTAYVTTRALRLLSVAKSVIVWPRLVAQEDGV
jgi:hypothetical protein